MPAKTISKRKPIKPRRVVSESGKVVAVIIDIDEYQELQRQLGEAPTPAEENSPEALELLKKAEADIKAGQLTRHADVVKAVRKRRHQHD
jgi:PHD/YefM family antitoxin component YafN of YafNO toxin-antitoxin module